jgi:hypothetical protein
MAWLHQTQQETMHRNLWIVKLLVAIVMEIRPGRIPVVFPNGLPMIAICARKKNKHTL